MEVQKLGKSICNVLASGSRGNCVIYHNSIAFSMGVPFSYIKPYLYQLKLIILDHVHSDHFNVSTIKKIAFERPTVRFCCGEWMLPYLTGIKNIDVVEFGKVYDYGEFKVSPVKAFHDVPNLGMRIYKGNHRILHMTDTVHLEGISAKNYDLYCLESNYDAETVYEIIREKEARGEYAHQKGAINSHLSFQQANDFFFKNKGENSVLVRLHESSSSL